MRARCRAPCARAADASRARARAHALCPVRRCRSDAQRLVVEFVRRAKEAGEFEADEATRELRAKLPTYALPQSPFLRSAKCVLKKTAKVVAFVAFVAIVARVATADRRARGRR